MSDVDDRSSKQTRVKMLLDNVRFVLRMDASAQNTGNLSLSSSKQALSVNQEVAMMRGKSTQPSDSRHRSVAKLPMAPSWPRIKLRTCLVSPVRY